MLQELLKANRFIAGHAKEVITDYRNQYHLMAPIGWINDPNGFVYFKGEYHLFYQYYPYDSVWGPMHWGHAKSRDLVHWEELPVALAPSESYDNEGCFSGSAIEKEGKLYLVYTGCNKKDGKMRQIQCLAVSEDGIHFEKYAGNPIIDEEQLKGIASTEDFRDPKIFKKGDAYYAVVAAKTADARGQILLFRSSDLLNWDFYSVLLTGEVNQGIMWECPDLFELDGKDVLILSPIQMQEDGYSYKNTSSTVAFIGEVDWETGHFSTENYHEIDCGLDFYAPQTCENLQGQRMMVAWMQMWDRRMPTNEFKHGWAGSMTLPRELHVENNCLVQKPIATIYQAIEEEVALAVKDLEAQSYELKDCIAEQDYLHLVIDMQQATKINLQYAKSATEAVELSYDAAETCFTMSRKNIGYELPGSEKEMLTERSVKLALNQQPLEIEIFRDTSAIEIFLNGGKTMTMTFYETEKGRDFILTADSKVKFSLNSGEFNLQKEG
ncbi:beta-fructofuranosidase [Enterococcus sp. PF1-24]|uniref:glycoside hydrolase family 32 protein n=1 Tax=unclassified Enterococcus TaxID=2608891 RepID=UPI002473E1E0|nr:MULTISPECIES: glycoside hydrolase family 32 protein [unclassified Enterococcus]MDH6364301.1 beta-fructofuranosidase [Enterococcus sp. PFB1-1]MDH6401340.1 beta-fructofuranosidase [Enterococcus sp. PF1-24]